MYLNRACTPLSMMLTACLTFKRTIIRGYSIQILFYGCAAVEALLLLHQSKHVRSIHCCEGLRQTTGCTWSGAVHFAYRWQIFSVVYLRICPLLAQF